MQNLLTVVLPVGKVASKESTRPALELIWILEPEAPKAILATVFVPCLCRLEMAAITLTISDLHIIMDRLVALATQKNQINQAFLTQRLICPVVKL